MFSNIGGKIKVLAKVGCWLGIIFSVIRTIYIWSKSTQYQSTFLTGLITLVLGCLAAWVGSFLIYGFGELIDRTISIDRTLEEMNNPEKPEAPAAASFLDKPTGMDEETRDKQILADGGWKCPCGRANYSYVFTCACGRHKKDVMGTDA